MTVGKKLTLSVGVMIVLGLVNGITSLNIIGRLNAQLDDATQAGVRRIQLGGDINTAGANMLAGMRGLILNSYAKMPDRVQKSRELFDAAANTWQKSIDELRPLIASDEGRKCIDRLQEGLKAWRVVIEDIAKEPDPEEAVRILIKRAYPIYDENQNDTKAYSDIQDRILVSQRAAGQSLNSASRWTVLGILTLSLFAGAATLFVVRRTSGTLQQAAR